MHESQHSTPDRLRIVGLTLGDPFNPISRSGVNFNVFSRFSKLCDLRGVYDLDIRGRQKYLLAIKNFSFKMSKWGNKLHQNPTAFRMRTDMAEQMLGRIDYDFDLIYQDGAMFMPGWNPNVPYVSYHDSNIILSAKGKPYSQGAHYVGETLRKTIEQERMVYEKASLIFSMSEWLRESLIRDFGIPEQKVVTVFAGTNLEARDFKKHYDGKTILFVGRNFERKGGHALLTAFKAVRKEVKDAKLLIVGPNLNIDEEGVKILGRVNDKQVLAELFRQASVFALPSLYEPFGIVFAEAFAYKTPSIGSSICAMPEIIENEKGGFLVPPGDHRALSKRLIDLLRDEALSRQMGEYGFHKVKTIFNWDVVLEKMISSYLKMV